MSDMSKSHFTVQPRTSVAVAAPCRTEVGRAYDVGFTHIWTMRPG